MNLPVRENGSYRTLDLVGRNIDRCEKVGFIFKRDIIWHKTNGVKAHFGTYPYPGGILLNNMHEFVLEFQKPAPRGKAKYEHVTAEQREASRLSKEFWLNLKNSDVWLLRPQLSGNGRRHVAPFPLELPERLIRAYTFVGETVLDPFLGSGTTLLAAARLERNGLGYEINPHYAALAAEILYKEKEKSGL
jgi:DNA modification methylase